MTLRAIRWLCGVGMQRRQSRAYQFYMIEISSSGLHTDTSSYKIRTAML